MSWIPVWTATALLPIIASALAAHRFGWRNVITASVLAVLVSLSIIGAWIDPKQVCVAHPTDWLSKGASALDEKRPLRVFLTRGKG